MKSNNDIGNLCGGRLRELRTNQGKKLVEVSAALLVDYQITLDSSGLGRIERQQRCVFDFELLAFSKILGTSVQYLLTGEE